MVACRGEAISAVYGAKSQRYVSKCTMPFERHESFRIGESAAVVFNVIVNRNNDVTKDDESYSVKRS